MTERERFEEWLRNSDPNTATEEWRRGQSVVSLAEKLMWLAWQARAEQAEAELARIATAHRSKGR